VEAFVALTDREWFDRLSRMDGVDEVNFWSPHTRKLKNFTRGEPVLFKLKAREGRAIVGGGFFEHFTTLPISIAWDTFEEKNGAASLTEVRQRIARLRYDETDPWAEYVIGCHLLVEPFFWDEEDWIPEPPDWHPNIQRGRSYDLTTSEGRWLWDAVVARLQGDPRGGQAGREPGELPEIPGGYGDPVTRPHRVGQGTFKSVILDVYGRRCAVTREKALPVLDAAHIRPYSEEPRHYVRNGLLLRSDIHRLFDAGYVTVTPEYRVEVSHRIRTDFNDGENYERLQGLGVVVPQQEEWRPDPQGLLWHNEEVFRS
jgi:putative restriction endonuclease